QEFGTPHAAAKAEPVGALIGSALSCGRTANAHAEHFGKAQATKVQGHALLAGGAAVQPVGVGRRRPVGDGLKGSWAVATNFAFLFACLGNSRAPFTWAAPWAISIKHMQSDDGVAVTALAIWSPLLVPASRAHIRPALRLPPRVGPRS